jgi:acyl transferase domain-containing protein
LVRVFLVVNTQCLKRTRAGLQALYQFLFSLETFTD